jgi:hypothetical protein
VVKINVGQTTPTITWANPADIVYGTALGATQLDATASWVVGGRTVNVPGTFSYSPAANTILGTGANQMLGATFTPADRADYTTTTAIVRINVDSTNPPPHVSEIVEAGRTKKGLTAIAVVFDEALNSVSANNSALYSILGSVKKHRKTVYSSKVGIKTVTFDGNAQVTIKFARPYKGAVKATVLGRVLAADGASGDINYSAVVN